MTSKNSVNGPLDVRVECVFRTLIHIEGQHIDYQHGEMVNTLCESHSIRGLV